MTTPEEGNAPAIKREDYVELVQNLRRDLADLPDPAKTTDPEQLEQAITQLDSAAQQIEASQMGRDNDDLIDDLAEQRRLFEAKLERQKELAEARVELDRQLAAAVSLFKEGGTADITLRKYREAQNYVKSCRDKYTNWDPDEIDELDRLDTRASSAYEAFSLDHELPVTRLEQEEIASLILRFVEQEKDDPTYIVTFFSEPTLGAPSQRMTVTKALGFARSILLSQWNEKVTEYLKEAKARLENEPRSPREALSWVERCDTLPGRDDPGIGIRLASTRLETIEAVRSETQTAVRQLESAERELRLVERALAPPAPDAVAAHEHFKAARDHYPYTPGLDEAEQAIAATTATEIPVLLTSVQTNLEQEVWGEVKAQLNRVQELFALLPAEAMSTARAQYDTLRAVHNAIEPLTLIGGLDVTAQRKRLQDAQQYFATTFWPNWTSFQEQLARLEALQNLETLKQRIADACTSKASVPEIESLVAVVTELQETPPAGTTSAERSDLPRLLEKLLSWRGFARARDELEKAPKAGTSTSTTLDNFTFEYVADLQIAEAGLAAAAKDGGANAAAYSANLNNRLRNLQQNDQRAKQTLDEAQEFLQRNANALNEDLQQLRGRLSQDLKLPSSYRQDLLEAYRTATIRLATSYDAELRKLLNNSKPYFKSLDRQKVESLERELTELGRQIGSEALIESSVQAELGYALAFARAFQMEQAVSTGMRTWSQVKEAWTTAQKKAEQDSEMSDYAFRQSRKANKQAEFIKSADATSSDAEKILRQLTEDPLLQDDWEVWYRYGECLFTQAQDALSPDLPFTEIGQEQARVQEWLKTARRALRRAESQVQNKVVSEGLGMNARTNLAQLLGEIEYWILLQTTIATYWKKLELSSLSHADCKELLDTYGDASGRLKTKQKATDDAFPDVKVWHDRLWAQSLGVAKERLGSQLMELASTDILGRFDALLGLAILFPEDSVIQARLKDESATILGALDNLIEQTNKDYSAQHFSQRYQLHHNELPGEQQSVELQLIDAEGTKRQLATYSETLTLVKLPDFSVSTDKLSEMDNALKGWVNELKLFRAALVTARHLAEGGMNTPGQFEKAQHILRLRINETPDLPQVPIEFSNTSHPSYRNSVDLVNRLIARRNKQAQYKNDIQDLIGREVAGAAVALRWREGLIPSDAVQLAAEQAQLDEIIVILRELDGKLQDMVKEEEQDATLLQRSLEYRLPENPSMYYRSPSAIQPIIAKKINQYNTAQRWFEQRLAPDGGLGNVVQWEVARSQIVRDRDRGHKGLGMAMLRCRTVREGDDEAESGELSLRHALLALSSASMVAILQENEDDANFILYGATETLNQKRLQLERLIRSQIADSERLEEDIKNRIGRFQSTWDTFAAKQSELMSARKPFRGSWDQTNIWKEYAEAAQAFCKISPEYDAFLTATAAVERKTGLKTYCNEDGE